MYTCIRSGSRITASTEHHISSAVVCNRVPREHKVLWVARIICTITRGFKEQPTGSCTILRVALYVRARTGCCSRVFRASCTFCACCVPRVACLCVGERACL